MRTLRRRTAALLAAAVITAGLAVSSEVRGPAATASEPAPRPAVPGDERFKASCRTKINGSHVTAYCHNPYPETDRVRLHIECARWWDLDSDSAPAEVAPAAYVQLTDRCWKEIGSVWVSHERIRPAHPDN